MAFDWDGADLETIKFALSMPEGHDGEHRDHFIARALLDLHERVKALEGHHHAIDGTTITSRPLRATENERIFKPLDSDKP